MKKFSTVIGVLITIIVMVSSATALPNIENSKIVDILDKNKDIKMLTATLLDDSRFIELILKILNFLQNIFALIITIFMPLTPILQIISEILNNILEKLEPWENLGAAILGIIEAIYTLIEAIQNLIDNPQIIYN